MTPRVKSACRDFQSTLSMRRATDSLDCVPEDLPISIHALHEESDTITRGAREETVAVFQSTLSMRRATLRRTDVEQHRKISIHALHEESDFQIVQRFVDALISIHALHEESDLRSLHMRHVISISIHALHEESDFITPGLRLLVLNFNPRSP